MISPNCAPLACAELNARTFPPPFSTSSVSATHRLRAAASGVRNNASVMSSVSTAPSSCAAKTCAGPYSARSGFAANVSKKASNARVSSAALVSLMMVITAGVSSTSLSAPLNAELACAGTILAFVLHHRSDVAPDGFEFEVAEERVLGESGAGDHEALDLLEVDVALDGGEDVLVERLEGFVVARGGGASLAGHRLLHFRAMGGDGCAHEREVGEALGDEEDGEVGARGGVRGFAESRDVDGVPLVFLDLHGATDVDVESVVGAELDVLRLGRVAALDADRLAVAVVVDRLDVHAELDADALGVAAAAAAELAAARPAARHLP